MSSHVSEDHASSCAFTFADGRQCRMLHHDKSKYCYDHNRKLLHLYETDQTASEIAVPLEGDFVPATALTRVFRAVAGGRIDPKTASALTRVASALLKSIRPASDEFQSCYLENYWAQLVRRTTIAISPTTTHQPHANVSAKVTDSNTGSPSV
jgi:hypothetical protein